jgi:hypothetical protein
MLYLKKIYFTIFNVAEAGMAITTQLVTNANCKPTVYMTGLKQ